MARAEEKDKTKLLTREEWRARRELRRKKQRVDNIKRAAKMHAARLKAETESLESPNELTPSIFVGCSGWRYWKWRDSFYAGVPQKDWFEHYLKHFDTVEINASFYSWPTVAGVQSWRRQPGRKKFVYTVKVCELITHIKKFKGTKTLVKDFGIIADILGDRTGCFLFQLPPSYRYTKTRLNDIVSQLDPARRNVVEFRHASWYAEGVYELLRDHDVALVIADHGHRALPTPPRTASWDYVRLHFGHRGRRGNYSPSEIHEWASRIRQSERENWVYFNNDWEAFAPANARELLRALQTQQAAA